MALLKKIKAFYNRSEENRMQFFEIVGFIFLPIAALAVLFLIVYFYIF